MAPAVRSFSVWVGLVLAVASSAAWLVWHFDGRPQPHVDDLDDLTAATALVESVALDQEDRHVLAGDGRGHSSRTTTGSHR